LELGGVCLSKIGVNAQKGKFSGGNLTKIRWAKNISKKTWQTAWTKGKTGFTFASRF
jgi:hypothetical protein